MFYFYQCCINRLIRLTMGKKGRGRGDTNSSNQNQNSAYDEAELTIQCLSLHQLLSKRMSKLRELNNGDFCYILSMKWLKDWKEFVGYEEVTGQQGNFKKGKKIGKRHPGKINTQLLGSNKNLYKIPEEMDQYQYLNKVIGDKKEKDDDYIAVTKEIWTELYSRYQGQEVMRPVRKKKGGIYYDSELLQCDVIFVDMKSEDIVERIKKTPKAKYKEFFPSERMQLSNIWDFKSLHQFFRQYCLITYNSENIKIWKCYSHLSVYPLIQSLVESIKQRKDEVRARRLVDQKYYDKDIDEYIKSTHSLLIQIDGNLKSAHETEDIVGYCEECVEKKNILPYSCVCKQVYYCSQKCRMVDQSFHWGTCEAAFDSEDDEEYEIKIAQRVPIAGLNNLGNTCYMNSTLQSLISLDCLRDYFGCNNYLEEISQKQLKQTKGVFVKKISKTIKQLSESKDSYSPWPLKGQIDYFLNPFKGDKQHDANDFLIHFLNTINQFLAKEEQKAYHRLFENNFIGQYKSIVICPDCQDTKVNNQIFLTISLPIKQKLKIQTYNYTVVQSHRLNRKGKIQIEDNWNQMRKSVNAEKSMICLQKQPEGLIEVDQSKQPEKALRGLKGDIYYYKNIEKIQGEQLFCFNLITTKMLCGNKLKSNYGLPILIGVKLQEATIGTLWLSVIKYFFEDKQEIVQEAIKMQTKYFQSVENIVKIEAKEMKEGEQETQSSTIKLLVEDFNNQLKQFTQKIGIQIVIIDFKRYKNTCSFCKKKCDGCVLPIELDMSFADYFQNKLKQIRFEVLLKQTLQVVIENEMLSKNGEPNIHDCISLFNQPEQLDEQNAWYCEKCDMMRLAFKEMEVKKFPSIIIFHLNRFKTVEGKKIKNTEPIQYNQYEIFGSQQYRLMSVIIHEGSMEGGHYWAISIRENNYYIFNDSKVSKTDKIWNKNAYILIYSQWKP